jgi:hypothetical protein
MKGFDENLTFRESVTTVEEPMRKIFINVLVIVNSNECLSRDSSGQASMTIIKHGKHFERNKVYLINSSDEG